MINDATMTFIPNQDPTNPIIPAEEIVFSIPYSKILQAQDFCKDEELEYCFVGYKNYDWYISGIPTGLDPAIKVDDNGIHADTSKQYIHCLTEGE